ncbi:hypothetical protein BOX15_Mlig016899g3, partial [Macrostomum lignano]
KHCKFANQELIMHRYCLALLLLLLQLAQLPLASSSLRAHRSLLPNGCPLPLPSLVGCDDRLAGRVHLHSKAPSPMPLNNSTTSSSAEIHEVSGCKLVSVHQIEGRRCRGGTVSKACYVTEACEDPRRCREVPEPRRQLAEVFLGPCLGEFAYQWVPVTASRCLPVRH